MSATVNVNGRISSDRDAVISVFDHGFLYGEGIYETFRTYDRRPFLYDRHMRRMRRSADLISLALPFTDRDLLERIDALNERWRQDGHELGLKVGLHEGPALAVNADDRLDYFGQTVNIAARVQALAQAGEIWHTDEVLNAEGVEAFLRSKRFAEKPHSVMLKGVGQPIRVHQWHIAAADAAEP